LSILIFAGYFADDRRPPLYRPWEAKMNRSEKIRLILNEALQPLELDIIDESSLHAGHSGAREGGQTHYRVDIVSAAFAGKGRLARQRLVYDLLTDEFSDGLHALTIKARAPNE
jgi:BolA protein